MTLLNTMKSQVYREVSKLSFKVVGALQSCNSGQKIKLVIAACLWNNPQVNLNLLTGCGVSDASVDLCS